MEYSLKFIEMCKEATVLQNKRISIVTKGLGDFNISVKDVKPGDKYATLLTVDGVTYRNELYLIPDYPGTRVPSTAIWLPSIDDLMAVLMETEVDLEHKHTDYGWIVKFFHWLNADMTRWIPSWNHNQLWLAFTMYTLEKKYWRGGTWKT